MGTEGIASTQFSRKREIGERQRRQEKSLLRAILLDTSILTAMIVASIASGSLTVLAELLRGVLALSTEVVSLVTMLRFHRGKFAEFEYGIGKIERIVTIIIAGGLFISAMYTLSSALGRLAQPSVLPTPGMIFAVVVASTNLTVNLFCAGDFVRVNAEEASTILDDQLKARLVKTTASAIVVVVLVLATWLPDPKAATLVDATGGFLAASYMTWIGIDLLRDALPDLMDRSLPEREQLLILRIVTRYFDDFDQFDAVRSRRSGGHSFIDLDLEFDANMPLWEVNRRCRAIQKDLVELIPDAIVSVTPRVSARWAPPDEQVS